MIAQKINYIIGLMLIILLSSCEKNIKIQSSNLPPKLVVDATIENNEQPFVTLSKSLNYFDKLSLTQLQNSFENNAIVTISNSTRSIILREYAIPISGGVIYVYAPNFNADTTFKGQLGKAYSLNIKTTNGNIYNATTTIPQLRKRVDSLRWEKAPPIIADTNRRIIYGRFFEPTPLGDYVRVFTKVNSEPFYFAGNSVYDDIFVDGSSYEFKIDRNYSRVVPTNDEYRDFYTRGDTVTLKTSNIDKPSYDFWQIPFFEFKNRL